MASCQSLSLPILRSPKRFHFVQSEHHNHSRAVRRRSIVSELTQITPNDQGRSEHELRQAIDFYGVFLAMAGHDLRQPLQTIMSTFEWLVRRLHTTSEQEYLRRGRFAVTRLSEQLEPAHRGDPSSRAFSQRPT
jgi:signal transduction histidine kinase